MTILSHPKYITMKKVTFYHAGCPVCINAEDELLELMDTSKIDLEIVHLAQQPEEISKAENAGVQSVPALVMDNGNVLHINHGADISQLKA